MQGLLLCFRISRRSQKRQMVDRKKKKKPAILIEELSISTPHNNKLRAASIEDALRMGSFTREYEMMQLDITSQPSDKREGT
jgi:hypothetical protein